MRPRTSLALAALLFACGDAPEAQLEATGDGGDSYANTNDARARPNLIDKITGRYFPTCPADMVRIGGFCMDRYEAPNTFGAQPLAMQTATDGEAWCKDHGKRLCTEAEWVRACNGVSKRAYPYGQNHETARCNDDKIWISPNWATLGTWPSGAAKTEAERLYQGEPSGSRKGCESEEGAFDLTGNVAEWVTRSFENSTNYDHVMKGCYWAGCYGGSMPSCAFVNPAHPGSFRSYEAGFRCCG